MRINLGCGDRYAPGWHNVDHAGCPHRVDQYVDLTAALPWPARSVELVYAGHVLEHLSLAACRLLLARLLDCMRPGGTILVVGPDLDRARPMAAAGTLDVPLDSLIRGAHRWPGDEHRWECTEKQVVDLLSGAGWQGVLGVGIGWVPFGWPVADRRPQWQCAVWGIAGADPVTGGRP